MHIQSNQQISPITHKRLPFRPQQAKFTHRRVYELANMLDISSKEAKRRLESLTQERYDLLRKLMDVYNQGNNKTLNPQIIFDILSTIKKPDKVHFDLLDCFSGSLNAIKGIFELSGDKSEINFSKRFSKEVFNNNNYDETILLDILKSPFKREYIENIDKYKSYLRINCENPQAIQDLDKMLENGNFDSKIYEKAELIKKFKTRLGGSELLPDNDIQEYYSKEGIKFLSTLVKHTRITKIHTEKDNPVLLSIYQTTTKENVNIRRSIISYYENATLKDAKDYSEELNALKSIFERIDNDKYAKKFIIKFLDTDTNIETFKDLNHILDTVPSVKAYVFHKNLTKIVANTKPGETRDKLLQERISDPDYIETWRLKGRKESLRYGYIKKNSTFKNFLNSVINQINEIRYNILSLQKEKTSNKVGDSVNEIMHNEESGVSNIVVHDVQNTQGSELPDIVAHDVQNTQGSELPDIVVHDVQNTQGSELPDIVAHDVQNTQGSELPDIVAHDVQNTQGSQDLVAEEKTKQEIPSVRIVNKTLKPSKIELRKSVVNLIKEKLHAKTVEKQEGLYSEKVTKMRLKLLPEIFNSIKETRATDRVVGKKKSYSANKDAIDLYSRINGQNRKLIRYMLMKRNVDGTRLFEVKKIIEFIDKANSQIQQAKEADTKFMAENLRGYFNKIRQRKVEQFIDVVNETRTKNASEKNKKSSVTKEELNNLYSRITEQNSKIISYMLMKQKDNGTRMFGINEIIAFIDDANSQVREIKEKNPKLMAKLVEGYFDRLYQTKLVNKYGYITQEEDKGCFNLYATQLEQYRKLAPKDVKDYYNHLYQAKLEEYGKLTKPKKSKKTQKA